MLTTYQYSSEIVIHVISIKSNPLQLILQLMKMMRSTILPEKQNEINPPSFIIVTIYLIAEL